MTDNSDQPGVLPSPTQPGTENESAPTSISGVWKAVQHVESTVQKGFRWSDLKIIVGLAVTIGATTWGAYTKLVGVAQAQAAQSTAKVQDQADATQRELVRYEGVNDASVLGVKADVQEVRNAQAETQSDIRALYRFMQTHTPQDRLERPAPKPKPPAVVGALDGGVSLDAGHQ